MKKRLITSVLLAFSSSVFAANKPESHVFSDLYVSYASERYEIHIDPVPGTDTYNCTQVKYSDNRDPKIIYFWSVKGNEMVKGETRTLLEGATCEFRFLGNKISCKRDNMELYICQHVTMFMGQYTSKFNANFFKGSESEHLGDVYERIESKETEPVEEVDDEDLENEEI